MGRNNTIKYILIVCFGVQSLYVKSQQDPLFNKYMFNPLFINPAYAGTREAVSTVLMHRSQWLGFDGAPITQTLSIHAPMSQKKMGIGVNFMRDQIGPTTNYGILGNYAYRIRLWQGKLGFGIRAGLYNYNFFWNKLILKDEEVSPIIFNNSYWTPSFDFGVRYHDKNTYAGLTVSHINQPSLNKNMLSNSLYDSANYAYGLIPHIKLMGGYAFEIHEGIVFKPSFLVQTSTSLNTIADVNASILLNNVLWAGATYRTNKTIIAIVQYDINEFWSLGYSYDIILNNLVYHNAGSHELFLRYEFEWKKSKMLSPRYF